MIRLSRLTVTQSQTHNLIAQKVIEKSSDRDQGLVMTKIN
jgi:hypothetical protein